MFDSMDASIDNLILNIDAIIELYEEEIVKKQSFAARDNHYLIVAHNNTNMLGLFSLLLT